MNAEQHADNITKLTTRKDILNYIRAVEAAAVASEREAILNMVNDFQVDSDVAFMTRHRIAAAIRARSNGAGRE